MKHLSATILAMAASAAVAAPAFAECRIQERAEFTSQIKSLKSDARNDLNTLRNAAEVLKRNDMEDTCEAVVEAMTELRTTLTKDTTAAAAGNDRSGERLAAADREPNRAARTDAGSAEADMTRMRASKLMGADLIGPAGEEIAEIDDLVLNDNGANYAIVSFGGFLGLGDDQAAVPVKRIEVVRDGDDVTFKLPMTIEQLKTAPRFKKGSDEWFADDGWWSKNDSYYSSVSASSERD